MTWMTKKQATVALSSTEAEYMALTATAQEVIYNRHLIESVEFEQKGPTIVYCDNQSSIALTKNPVHHARTRHIDIKQHFIRQAVLNKQVEMRYIHTDENVADLFSKPLPQEKRVKHCNALGLVNLQDEPGSSSVKLKNA